LHWSSVGSACRIGGNAEQHRGKRESVHGAREGAPAYQVHRGGTLLDKWFASSTTSPTSSMQNADNDFATLLIEARAREGRCVTGRPSPPPTGQPWVSDGRGHRPHAIARWLEPDDSTLRRAIPGRNCDEPA
jgi:hypothetical protein